MPKNIVRRKLISQLRVFGFSGPYGGGKHEFMKKGELKLRIPNKHSGDLSVSLVNEILKQAEISKQDWDKKFQG